MHEQASHTEGVDQIESRVAELKAATMELDTESIGTHKVGQNEVGLKAMSDEIKALHNTLVEYKEADGTEATIRCRIKEMTEMLDSEPEGAGA